MLPTTVAGFAVLGSTTALLGAAIAAAGVVKAEKAFKGPISMLDIRNDGRKASRTAKWGLIVIAIGTVFQDVAAAGPFWN